ncbi:MAG: hypothetical protein QNJ72_12495 [Pleurocapsa sp. MO_226.B13]|nr:hypothetical protein [Pleurocapsa sp. MO_226.B13]
MVDRGWCSAIASKLINISSQIKGYINVTGDRNINRGEGSNYNEKIEGDYYEQKGNYGIGHMSGGEIKGNAKVAGVINEVQPKNLAEVAANLEDLLNYFEVNNPTITDAQEVVKTFTERQPELMDAEIIEEAIQATPTLKQRLMAAGEAACVETVKMFLPPVGVAIETVKAWNNPE